MSPLDSLLPTLALVVSVASFAYAFAKGRYDQVTSVRPALIFVYEPGEGWVIQNVGNGPAMNILIAQKGPEAGAGRANWEGPVRIAPLARDKSFQLHWTAHTNVHALGATYE